MQFDLAPSYLQNRVTPDTPGASWPDGRDWFVQWQLGMREAAGDVVVNTQTALTYSVVWRCVNYIASTIASLCWHVYEESEDGKTKVPIHDNIAWTLEMQANPEMSAFDWRQVMLRDALLWGNGFAEIERNGAGKPLWLHRIDPARVLVTREREKPWRLMYVVTGPDGGTDDIIDPANMFHLKGFSPDGIVGYSPIAVARRAIELGLQQEQYGIGYFRRGPTPGGFLEAPGNIKEEERRSMSQSFSDRYGGSRNAGRVPVLSGGMKFTPFDMPNADAQYLESRGFQGEEIARIFGVPQHIAGILTHSTNNNIEHQGIEAVQYCLYPWCRRLETAADLALFGRTNQGRKRTKLDLRTLLRGDSAAQTSSLTSQVNGGLRTIDEARAELDLNPIPGGDTPLIQGAMIPLNSVLSGAGKPQPGMAKTGKPGAAPVAPVSTTAPEPPELLDVPELLQSYAYDCGAACVQSVAEFFGVDGGRTEDDYIAELETTAADGTSPDAIIDWLNDAGLVTTSGSGITLDDLRCCFRMGRPVIVPMQPEPDPVTGNSNGHWCVVIGCGLGQVFLMDPVAGRIMIAEDDFDSRWHDLEADAVISDHFGIVVGEGFGMEMEAGETANPMAPEEMGEYGSAAALARLVLRNCGGPGSGVPGPCPEGGEEGGKEAPLPHTRGGKDNTPNPALSKESRPHLTEAEAKAAGNYAATGYDRINAALRDGQAPPADKYGGADSPDKVHGELQKAFEKTTPFAQPVTATRGVNLEPADAAKLIGSLQAAKEAGGTIRLPGYTSTVVGAAGTPFGGNVTLSIKAVQGLDLKPYSSSPKEHELLLDHNSTFRVTSVNQDGGKYHVELEQVPPEKQKQQEQSGGKSVWQKLRGVFGKSGGASNRAGVAVMNKAADSKFTDDDWDFWEVSVDDGSAAEIVAAFAPLLADVYTRQLKVEATRAAAHENPTPRRLREGIETGHLGTAAERLQMWAEGFFTNGAVDHIAVAVAPVVAALLTATRRTGDVQALAKRLAADHVAQSKAGVGKAAAADRPARQAARHLAMIFACGGPGSGVPGPCPEKGGESSTPVTKANPGTGKLADGTKVEFVPHPNQRTDETTVMVDAAKLESAWEKDDQYIPPGGGGGSSVPGRREAFEKFLATGKPVEASRVTVDEKGNASFIDGRHRFSVLRDRGADRVAVTISKGEAGRLK